MEQEHGNFRSRKRKKKDRVVDFLGGFVLIFIS